MDLPAWQLELTQPRWLLGLVLLVPLALAGRRRLTGFGPWRQAASFGFRGGVVVFVVLALCQPQLTTPTRERFVVFCVDQSRSVAPQAEEVVRPYLDEAARSGRGRFAVTSLAYSADRATGTGSEPPQQAGSRTAAGGGEAPVPFAADGTDLAAAIVAARALAPAEYVPHIVLCTDGRQTRGNALATAKAVGAPVSTVPLPSRGVPEVQVDEVRAPGQVREGESFEVEVILQSDHDDQGRVELVEGDRRVEERSVQVTRGTTRLRFTAALSGSRLTSLTARLGGFRDTEPANNAASALVFVAARPRVLLIENQPRLAEHLAKALASQLIEVEACSPERLPGSLAELDGYELVVLSNVPAAALEGPKMGLLQQYVRDLGGGLVVVGGDRAFSPGGYRGTVLEEALPVVSQYRERKARPSFAMLLVLDRSLSMQKGDAIVLAKQAARRAVEMLQPQDQVGVLAFDDASAWIAPLAACSDREAVLRAIDTIEAGGATDMYPAMDKAYLALDAAMARRKHVLVLTDGLPHPGDFEGLARRMAAAGITVSTVGVGPEPARPLLEDIARIGGGHAWFCSDPASIPSVFAVETASASRMGIVEEPFLARVVRPAALIRDLELGAAPRLLGYAQTQPKPGVQVVLAAEEGDPLLAWWRHGRGISVAFTSDVESRWAANWVRWAGFSRFWTRLVRHAMRRDEAEDFDLRLQRTGETCRVTLNALDRDGRFVNGAEATAELLRPGAMAVKIALVQDGPGRYTAVFPVRDVGRYLVEARLTYAGQLVYVGRRGLSVDYPDELRLGPTDRELLRAVAAASGGRDEPKPAELFAPDERTVPRTTLLWPYLLMAAAVALILDLGVRRLGWSR